MVNHIDKKKVEISETILKCSGELKCLNNLEK